jgi:hypothetical protein
METGPRGKNRAGAFFAKHPGLFRALTGSAPVFLAAMALFRCYAESALLSPSCFFSYYTAWHHVLWYWSTFSGILLLAHLTWNETVQNLLWLGYGTAAMGLPLVWAAVSGAPLALEYFQGTFSETLFHIVTFCWLYEGARPVAPELMLIFTGMSFLGWLYTGGARRALASGALMYLFVTLMAVQWFGVAPNTVAVWIVASRLTNHALQAVVFLHVFTVMMFLALWRAGAFSSAPGFFRKALGLGVLVLVLFSAAVFWTGWQTALFDAATSGLPVGCDAFIVTALLGKKRHGLPWWGWAALGVLLVMQAAVMVPVFLKQEHGLLPEIDQIARLRRL